jgi:hypothetical protein
MSDFSEVNSIKENVSSNFSLSINSLNGKK